MRRKAMGLLAALVALAVALGLAPGTALAEEVNLSTLTGDYGAQDGDVLTGTLAGDKQITVAPGATITLRDANITSLSSYAEYAGITPLGDATIMLEGANVVRGGYDEYPGVFAAEGFTLTIDGTGSLEASSNGWSCGIGSGYQKPAGNIVIAGGTVRATGGTSAAGVGSGHQANCGTITISGGTVTATGSNYAPGIGGGADGTCGTIAISGGTVTATGGKYAAGIGGGYDGGSCGNIAISGGTVTATGGQNAAGIGGGYQGGCGDVLIAPTVTRVEATKGEGAPHSVGAGGEGTCGTVTVGGVEGSVSQSPFVYPAEYPLWVGGTRVTSANAADVFDDGKVSYVPATEGEDPAPATLTLNGYSYAGPGYQYYTYYEDEQGEQPVLVWEERAGIYADEPLTLVVNGACSIDGIVADPEIGVSTGVYATKSLTIGGEGALTSTGSYVGIYSYGDLQIAVGAVTANGADTGIYSYGDLQIAVGAVTANGADTGIYTEGDVSIAGGSVTAAGVGEHSFSGISADGNLRIEGGTVMVSSANNGIISYDGGDVFITGGAVDADGGHDGIYTEGSVFITGGSVTAVGNKGCGVCGAEISIGAGVESVVSSGTAYALGGYDYVQYDHTSTTVKNAIAGTGWTDMAGTEGQAGIAASEGGQDLGAYKRAQFPALVPVEIVARDGRATFSAAGVAVPVADMFSIPEGAGEATFYVVPLAGEGSYDAKTGVLSVTRCGTFTVKASTAATGTHDAGAEVSATLTVDRADVAKARVVLARASYACNGKARKPKATVTLGGTTLVAGTDYSVGYKNNVRPGTATATVTGEGNYQGTATATFQITLAGAAGLSTAGHPAKGTIDASWGAVAGAKAYELSWRKAGGKWSTKTAKGTSATIGGLKAGGRYEVRVRAKAGTAAGAWSKSANRWLRKVSSLKATPGKSKGTIKASWAADAQATGGYIAYAYAKKDGKVLARRAVAAGKTSATLTGLESDKAYYVKVRPLRESAGTSYVGVQRYVKSAVKAK